MRKPGGFGLGQVPARLAPDATTTAVCGFCSTGCGLEIHLKNGEAINLSPSRDYPVNRGTACPKGWEALTPLAAPDRATHPLVRNAGGKLLPVVVGRGDRRDGDALQGDRRGARAAVGRVPGNRPDAQRGAGVSRRAREVRDGHGARRRQHAPVHGDRGRRVQAGVRVRRPALHLRRLRGIGRAGVRGIEPVHRAPDHVGARLQEPAQARDRRHRSAQDGDGGRGDAAPGAAAEVGPEAVLRHREPADRARLDRPRLHRRAHERLRGVRGGGRAVHAGGDGRGDRPARRGDREAGDHDPRARARVVLVDDGREPEPRGRAAGAGDRRDRAA